jgi:hypothetical protein
MNLLAALPSMFAPRRPPYRVPQTGEFLSQPKSAADMANSAMESTVRQFNQAYVQVVINGEKQISTERSL